MLPSTMPPVWDGDHICSSIIAVSQVAAHEVACFVCAMWFPGQINGLSATREDLNAPNRSILSIPVIVDQPEISRALEIRNCAMLIAPYGSNAGMEVISSSEERKRRTASVYVTEGPEFLATSCR